MTVFSLSILILIVPTPNSYATSVSVFSTDFSGGAPGQFSGVTTTESVQSYAGVGGFNNNFLRNLDSTTPTQAKTILTLNGLACHTSVDINFDAAIIDSWDGISGNPGPDAFQVTVDGNSVFNEIFAIASGTQTYENPPTGIQIGPNAQRGFHPSWVDGAYDMSMEPNFQGIAHTSTPITIEWFASGAGWQGANNQSLPDDESWAIDNVQVILNGIDDPSCIITPPEPIVGGTFLPIESTALILAGAQSTTWMIPVVLSVIGIGLFVVSRKSENS